MPLDVKFAKFLPKKFFRQKLVERQKSAPALTRRKAKERKEPRTPYWLTEQDFFTLLERTLTEVEDIDPNFAGKIIRRAFFEVYSLGEQRTVNVVLPTHRLVKYNRGRTGILVHGPVRFSVVYDPRNKLVRVLPGLWRAIIAAPLSEVRRKDGIDVLARHEQR